MHMIHEKKLVSVINLRLIENSPLRVYFPRHRKLIRVSLLNKADKVKLPLNGQREYDVQAHKVLAISSALV